VVVFGAYVQCAAMTISNYWVLDCMLSIQFRVLCCSRIVSEVRAWSWLIKQLCWLRTMALIKGVGETRKTAVRMMYKASDKARAICALCESLRRCSKKCCDNRCSSGKWWLSTDRLRCRVRSQCWENLVRYRNACRIPQPSFGGWLAYTSCMKRLRRSQ